MKQLPVLIIISLLFSLDSFSQSNIQIGALGVFSKTTGQGAEIVGNAQVAKNLSIGLGIRPIKFEEHSKLYIPVFGTLKYYYPLTKWRLFASLDPGYGIYPSEQLSDGVNNFHRNGTIYLSGGVGIMGTSKLAPYASVHFTKFGFTEGYGSFSQYRAISTFTFTAGIALNKLITANVLAKPKVSRPLQSQEYYLKKSKRQKNTAWILLGSGVALIGGGIAITSQQKDLETGAVAFVLIGGPGLITSLVSIPFFISSGHNKKKAMNISSSIEMQRNPVKMQPGLLCNSYPALSLKLEL